MDTESAFESIENQETKEVIDSISGEEFLTEFSRRYKVYEYTEGKGIRIVPTIPKNVRKEYLKIQRDEARLLKKLESGDNILDTIEMVTESGFAESSEKDLLKLGGLTAQLCIDKPFNTKEFWNTFEDKTGMLSQVFSEIIDICGSVEKDLIKFRQE